MRGDWRPNVFALISAGLLAAFLMGTASAQTWTAHTSFRSVQALDSDGTRIWAATSGGVFGFDPSTGEISRYTVVEGLHSVETSTIATDPSGGAVWIGYGDGVLDRLDPETGIVRTFRDIERADQFASRGINRIVPLGDSLMIATDFGLIIFDSIKEEVRDSYTRLGTLSPAVVCWDVTAGPLDGTTQLMVATEEGLAYAPLDGRNLQDPASWQQLTLGLPQGIATRAVATVGGRLFAGTSGDLYERDESGTFRPLFISSGGIGALHADAERVLGVERFKMFSAQQGGSASSSSINGYQDPTSITVGPAGSIWIGDAAGGLLEVPDPAGAGATVEALRAVEPAGPAEAQFTELSLGADGTLWGGATARTGSGFHRLSPDGTWTSFQSSSTNELAGRSRFTRVHGMPDGSAWAGSEGNGIAHVTADGLVEVYDASNSSLAPAAGTFDFIITGGVSADSDGRLWATTRGSGLPLHTRSTGGDWDGMPPYVGEGLTGRASAYGRIFVDSFDQKWIIVRDEANFNRIKGLMVLDTGSDPTTASDDDFRFFSQKGAAGQGLPSVNVRAVAEDRDGLVWIGTDSGIAYFINTGVVARDASARAIWPPWADRSQGAFVLFGLKVNDLAVDPANRLWVATDEGAWLIASAELGYELVSHVTADNSPLFSDNVVAVEVNDATGEVYFSTDRGLVSLAGDAVAPNQDGGDLYIYPNPARSDVLTGGITIEGLMDRAEIRVVTPAGSLIASFSSRGGRVVWDGRDRLGNPVPTGMYLVVAVPEDGGNAQHGRLAIIR